MMITDAQIHVLHVKSFDMRDSCSAADDVGLSNTPCWAGCR